MVEPIYLEISETEFILVTPSSKLKFSIQNIAQCISLHGLSCKDFGTFAKSSFIFGNIVVVGFDFVDGQYLSSSVGVFDDESFGQQLGIVLDA